MLSSILVVVLISCNQNTNLTVPTDYQGSIIKSAHNSDDKEDIQKLIIQVLNWSDTNETIALKPVLTDSKDSLIIGFDMEELKSNLKLLKKTNYFSSEFIDNYKHIILTLDKKLRNGEYGEWLVGDLPPFIFENDYIPWRNGQEWFSLDLAKIETINLTKNKGEFYLICEDQGHRCEGLENYAMRFEVVKEDNRWKISYLEGFNYKESTRKDGVL